MARLDIHVDHLPLSFGKHQGKTPEWVSENDPNWLVWAYENVKDKPVCSPALYADCKNSIADNPDHQGYTEQEVTDMFDAYIGGQIRKLKKDYP